MKLMTSDRPFYETVGTSFVSKLAGTVEEIFNQVDTDNSGTISIEELKEVFKLMDITSSEVIQLCYFNLLF